MLKEEPSESGDESAIGKGDNLRLSERKEQIEVEYRRENFLGWKTKGH